MIPDERLHAMITARSAQDPGSGNTDRARVRRCDRCGVKTIVGLDDTVAAFRAVADITPLSRQGEAVALLLGRTTYRLQLAPHWALRRRDRWQIASSPPDADVVVIPEHRCGQPLDQTPEPKPVTITEGIPF